MFLSCGVTPCLASTRKTTTSASAIACRVCFAISYRMPSVATGSNPPVSTTRYGRVADARAAEVPVAREAGEIGDERGARSRQPIEQRRLADVRTPDEDQGGQHGRCVTASRSDDSSGAATEHAASAPVGR